MSSSEQSGTGAEDQMSPSDIAALEAAFMEMLSSLEQPASTTTRDTLAAKASTTKAISSKVKLGLRASDIAFPSANNIYDHSPSAAFVLDNKMLNDFALAPRDPGLQMEQSDAAVGEFMRGRSLAKGSYPNSGSAPNDRSGEDNAACLLFFGAVDDDDSVPWTFVICDPARRRFLRAHPLYKKRLFVEPHHSAIPLYIAASGVHHEGLFATRSIAKDEVLFREPPLFLIIIPLEARLAMQFDKLTREWMPKRTQAALDALHTCWPGNDRFGRARTNIIGLDLPAMPQDPPRAGTVLGGLFQLASRANHSCAANVGFDWDYKTFQGSFKANRVIEAGEEIFFAYCDVNAPKEVRREELLRKYRFKCTCTRCGEI
ncbi:SET domain-containing protein [Exidia glandulosa HHB12029]|uniref:SET domain-containing protein n=1 Tax=Exidia glandulosa HHB12029 TaxID=1314781 RepID=A0A165J192_EXIGL|nr:SET domain-containing protein [Exidia glandulosa HHB12029]